MNNDGITYQEDKRPTIEEDEIDLIEVAKTIWSNRTIIYKTVAVFFVLGLLIAFLSPVEYEAETVLLPELQEQQMGGSAGKLLQQFGGLAGISMSDIQTGTISPQLYPQILKSAPFLLYLMEQPVYFSKEDTTVNIESYFNDIKSPSALGIVLEYTIGLPGKIKGAFSNKEVEEIISSTRNDGTIKLSKEQLELANSLSSRIIVKNDDNTSTVSIITEMPDPEAAAAVNNIATDYLTKYITNYRINKVKQNLEFIQERYNDSKVRFEKAQGILANFRDNNILITTARAKTEEEKLQTEFNLAFNVYNTLAQQLEQAKIKVQEETPVFNVLEPVKVPLEKSKPKRFILLVLSLIAGLIFSLMLVFFRPLLNKLKIVQ